MGLDMSFGFFVDDDTFIPTKDQLLEIAALLEETGVVDTTERGNLEKVIDDQYPNNDELVTMLGTDGEEKEGRRKEAEKGEELFCFSYRLTGSKSLPFFNKDGDVEEQFLRIYKDARCMQPIDGDTYTRFVIAEADDPYSGNGEDGLVELEEERDRDTVLASLRSHIADILGVSVKIETCWH